MAGKCIIIGAGDLTIGNINMTEEDYIIAVDGGLSYCGVLEVEPDMIIGDFDSITEQEKEAVQALKEQIPERIMELPVEKDDTDMLVAIKHGLELGYDIFHIYAGTGGRLDHTIANIQCLLYLKNHGATGYLIEGSGMILVVKNEAVSFKEGMEGYLSIFPLGQNAKGVTLKGLKYPLQDATLSNDYPLGISNEFTGEMSTVSVEDGELVCILQYVCD